MFILEFQNFNFKSIFIFEFTRELKDILGEAS